MEQAEKTKACKKCKGKGVYVKLGKPVFCHPCCDAILRQSKIDCSKYHIDIEISHHAISKRYKRGKEIADHIMYVLREKIGDIEPYLDKKCKARVNFYCKS